MTNGGRRGRLARLESRARALRPGRCPDCPPPGSIAFVKEDEDGNLLSGEYPPACPRCGGPHGEVRYIAVVVRRAEAAAEDAP
jgi:hypothetical protein